MRLTGRPVSTGRTDQDFHGRDREGVRRDVLALLRSEGAATVFVTHDPDEALHSADRIVLLRDGRIVQQGLPEALLNAPADIGAAAFFSPVTRVSGAVRNGVAETALGVVAGGGLGDGVTVTVAFRPRDIEIGDTGLAATVAAADIAADGLHVTAMTQAGEPILCILETTGAARVGDTIRLRAKAGKGFVFGR